MLYILYTLYFSIYKLYLYICMYLPSIFVYLSVHYLSIIIYIPIICLSLFHVAKIKIILT